MAKILGSTSDGGDDLQRHRVHGPPLHLGRVRFPLLQREASVFFILTRPFTGHMGAEPESIIGLFLIGTRGISRVARTPGVEKA